jgi:hypothetical protein
MLPDAESKENLKGAYPSSLTLVLLEATTASLAIVSPSGIFRALKQMSVQDYMFYENLFIN